MYFFLYFISYYKWYLDTKHYIFFMILLNPTAKERTKKRTNFPEQQNVFGYWIKEQNWKQIIIESKTLLKGEIFNEKYTQNKVPQSVLKPKIKNETKKKTEENCSQLSTLKYLIAFFCLLLLNLEKQTLSFFIWYKWTVFSTKPWRKKKAEWILYHLKVVSFHVFNLMKVGVCCKIKLNFMLESNAKEEYLFFFLYFLFFLVQLLLFPLP